MNDNHCDLLAVLCTIICTLDQISATTITILRAMLTRKAVLNSSNELHDKAAEQLVSWSGGALALILGTISLLYTLLCTVRFAITDHSAQVMFALM